MKQDGKQGLHSCPGWQKKRGGARSRGFFHTLLRGNDGCGSVADAAFDFFLDRSERLPG